MDVHPGLFDRLDLPDSIGALVQQWNICRKCRMQGTPVPYWGPADCDVLVVGMFPGKKEDKDRVLFSNKAGEYCRGWMNSIVMNRGTIGYTNVMACCPPYTGMSFQYKKEHMDACSPWLDKLIFLMNPKVIIGLGRLPLQRFTSIADPKIDTQRGIKRNYKGYPFIPMTHPAQMQQFRDKKRRRAFEERLLEDMHAVRAIIMDIFTEKPL